MADWVSISGFATAGGTFVLALATYASVRSANRSAGVTERALLAQIRPVLVNTRLNDPPEKIGFIDGHWMRVEGQRASFEVTPEAVFMAFTVRNVGAGVAVLDRWKIHTSPDLNGDPPEDFASFNRLTRDIYVPAGDLGFWQGALRDPAAPGFDEVQRVLAERERFAIDLLYEDHEGGQRTVTRFGITPVGEDGWMTAAARHWNIDRDDPRAE